ncbi:hypothetical protein [Flavobacterium davisii]|uniref:hypothetical protein n=1 Tax=Flavobacterium davisii TaxID=2906077 RepID=UPI0035CF0F47
MITAEFINYINSLKIENSNLQKEKESFLKLLNSLLQWTYDVHSNYNAGINKGFDKITWAKNLNLTQGTKVLNILFGIKSNPKDSYLLSLLGGLFGEKKGLTDSIDDTAWNPKKMAKGLSIKDVNITKFDTYHSRGKKNQFDAFLKGAQTAVKNRNLEDMLMRLFSQFIQPSSIELAIKILDWSEYAIKDDLDKEVKKLHLNLKNYHSFVSKYNVSLVSKTDENIVELDKKLGSIPYLAMVSHSLSHTKFWTEVEEGLKSAFSSAKNPGYKK